MIGGVIEMIVWHLWGWVLEVAARWCWSKVFLAKIFKIDLLREDRQNPNKLTNQHVINGLMSGRPL